MAKRVSPVTMRADGPLVPPTSLVCRGQEDRQGGGAATDDTKPCEQHGSTRRHQQRLQELANHLVNAAEEERWRISRYLHDSIAQDLSLANLRLGPLVNRLQEANLGDEAVKLAAVRALLVQAMEECRLAMAELAPPLLYELGVMPALQELARRMQDAQAVRIVVQGIGTECVLGSALRGLLFESARELVRNAIRHAAPSLITVSLQWGAREVRLSVVDDGRGFPTDGGGGGGASASGFGLFGIRQRVEGVGGRLDVASTRGAGATVTLHVPVPAGA